ncbi:MAG: TolC family protein [Ignavibacteriaceae bacterium]|nr:TolC family protein [Ignavibacteriaceae bacterium]
MKKRIKILLAALVILSAGMVRAQSIDSLINEALRNNKQLKSLEQKIKSAGYKSETVSYLPPPTLGVEFQQIPFTNADPFNQAISQNLSFSQMFMLGGKLSSMYEAEKQNVTMAENDYDIVKQKLIADVKGEYYKIWMNEHHAGLREDNINILKDLLGTAENSYKVNKTKYSEVLLLKAELASYQTELNVMNNNVQSEIYIMNNLLGRDINNSDLEVHHEWKIDTLALSGKEIEDMVLNNNPSIKKMGSMLKMSELEMHANNKELIPDLMIEGMVMRMPRGMLLTTKSDPMMLNGMGETEYMFSVMASVTLPFMPWSSGKITSKEEEIKADISGLSLERTDMEREMVSQLNASLKKLESKREEVLLYDNQVLPLYKQAFDAQLTEYKNNQLSINTLLETLRSILLKEEAQAEVKMDYEMTLADIYMMAGTR